MKINLGCGDDIRLHGYVNVDVLPKPDLPPEVYRQGDATSLEWLCPEGAAEEILALNLLSYLPLGAVGAALSNWVSRLNPGGLLKIAAPDLHRIATSFAAGTATLTEVALLLFGGQRHDFDFGRSAVDAQSLCDLLGALGMQIVAKRYEGPIFYLEAVKHV